MTIIEQRMCELQADIFENSIRRFNCSSSFFIARFMNSKYAKELDNTDDPYNFYSPNCVLDGLENTYPSLKEYQGQKYTQNVLRWIGYIYRAWSIIKKKSSSEIYKHLKGEEMYSLYDSFHTFGIDYCVTRLEEIVNEKIGRQKTDYEIFKEIMKNNYVNIKNI